MWISKGLILTGGFACVIKEYSYRAIKNTTEKNIKSKVAHSK